MPMNLRPQAFGMDQLVGSAGWLCKTRQVKNDLQNAALLVSSSVPKSDGFITAFQHAEALWHIGMCRLVYCILLVIQVVAQRSSAAVLLSRCFVGAGTLRGVQAQPGILTLRFGHS